MSGYYLGIDQGTTLTTAVLTDESWRIVAKASVAHRQHYPAPGWVEHDAMEIYENCLAATQQVLQQSGACVHDILALGLDHQGETCVVWDKETGLPIHNAIVWQDRRTADAAEALKARRGSEIRDICGMLPDAYHSATKIGWILDHVPGARARAEKGELLAGTLNTWLFWKLSGGTIYKTDPASANCTMLMDIRTTQWSDTLVELMDIPRSFLAEICDNNHLFGYTSPEAFLGGRVPIAGCTTDSPASLIGGGCVGKGILKCSYGTGSFMTLQTGCDVVISHQGLFSSCLWRLNGTPSYRLYGSSYIAGAAVEWLKNGIGIIESARDTEAMALSVPDSGDAYFVPAFAGLATPYWDQYARGMFIGITGGTTREHMVRAVLEGVAFQVANCYRAMRSEFGSDIRFMRVDGGMVENRFVMQFQSDVLGIPVNVPCEKETAAFGSACLAGYTMGALPSLECVKDLVQIKDVYQPRMSQDEREARLDRWLQAVDRCRGWVK